MNRRIIEKNRAILNSKSSWIDQERYLASRGQYGCPPLSLEKLAWPINEEPTYTDLICEAAERMIRMQGSLRYLEIGVSVGKNFLAVAQALNDCELFGFDREEINPILEKHFALLSTDGAMKRYTSGTNSIAYLQGDVQDAESWRRLKGQKFNLIFSDATHKPEDLLYEFDMMTRMELIDWTKFFLVWDDLDADPEGPMTGAFYDIADSIQERLEDRPMETLLLQVNGWLGQHEHPHTIGIINNMGLDRKAFGL